MDLRRAACWSAARWASAASRASISRNVAVGFQKSAEPTTCDDRRSSRKA
jgi:hypothetical protein